MILHIHKHLTDTVNHKEILNYFITANDEHHNILEYFLKKRAFDLCI